MPGNGSKTTGLCWARRWAAANVLLLAVAAAALVWAVTAGVSSPLLAKATSRSDAVPDLDTSPPAIEPLLARLSGRRLIRAAEVQAAVKDNGLAQRLLGQLKLQGIVQVQGGYAAYVQVADQGVRVVRSGDTLLDFVVESVEPGVVKLSLEGVMVNLGY